MPQIKPPLHRQQRPVQFSSLSVPGLLRSPPLFPLSRLMSCLVLSPIVLPFHLPPRPPSHLSSSGTANEGRRDGWREWKASLSLSLSLFLLFFLSFCPVTDYHGMDMDHGRPADLFHSNYFSSLLLRRKAPSFCGILFAQSAQMDVIHYWHVIRRGFHVRPCVVRRLRHSLFFYVK